MSRVGWALAHADSRRVGLAPCYSTHRGIRPGVRQDSQGFPHARSGRVGEIYRFGPIADKQEEAVFGRRAGALHARACIGRAFGGSVAGCSTGRRFEDIYPCRASGRASGSAAIGRKRKISLAHPPRVCPDHHRRENHGFAALRSVEHRGLRPWLPPGTSNAPSARAHARDGFAALQSCNILFS